MADPDPVATAERLRIPLFYGDPDKDYFSVEAWTHRVQGNVDATDWPDLTTMTNVFNSLRGRALSWYMVMKAREIPRFGEWLHFKPLFIEAFSPAKTSKAVVGIFNGLTQQPKESVIDFFNRVGKASDDLTSLRPALPDPVAADWTAQFQALAGWGALGAAHKQAQAQAFMRMGAKMDVEHVATQLFIAGLAKHLRDPFLAQAPAAGFPNLWAACQAALEVEKNTRDQNQLVKELQPMGAVAAIDAGSTNGSQGANINDATETELAVLRKFGFRGNRGRGRGGRGGGSSRGRGGSSSNSNGAQGAPKIDKNQCLGCGGYGHWKRDCQAKQNGGSRSYSRPAQRVHATSKDQEAGEADQHHDHRQDDHQPPAYESQHNPFVSALTLNYQ